MTFRPAEYTAAAVVALVSFWALVLAPDAGAQEKKPGTPTFKVGQAYHVVTNCQSTPIGPDTYVQSCFEELWAVLAIGKNGWLRVMTFDKDGDQTGEYWANSNLFQYVRDVVTAPVSAPPASHAKPEGTSVRR